jgi:hypothetical protein
MNSEIPDWALVPLVLLFTAIAVPLLFYPERVLAMLGPAIARHRITTWLYFKSPFRVRVTGLMYLAVAIALLVYRFQA